LRIVGGSAEHCPMDDLRACNARDGWLDHD
jgi:hypothetical protein